MAMFPCRLFFKSDSGETGAVTLPEANAFKTYSGHDEAERFPGQFIIAGGGIDPGHFERASFETFLIKQEPVRIPAQQLHALPVLGEEHEHVPAHRRQRGLGLDQVEQGVDALAHINRVLAHEVPVVGSYREHPSSFADRRRSYVSSNDITPSQLHSSRRRPTPSGKAMLTP